MSDIVYLSYMPERKAFGVKEDKIEKLRNEGKSPKIKIAPKDWKKINPKYAADKSNPMVAFLLGREDGYYLMMENYVKALAFVNVNLKILTHEDMVSELDDVCGLILPGRLDDPLNTFANPNLPKKPVLCSLTYVNMVREAEKRGIPILGIGAGAKIIGRLHGLRPKRAIDDDRSILRVKSLKLLNVFPESVLYRIMGNTRKVEIYSVSEPLLPIKNNFDLKVFAVCDDTPEAWGNDNILCVHWESEDVSVEANKYTLNIYKWLAKKAVAYQKALNRKLLLEKKSKKKS